MMITRKLKLAFAGILAAGLLAAAAASAGAASVPVVVVEAMKMENELAAPRAGRVARVAVSEGDSVEAGKVLVEIEQAGCDD